MTGIQKLSLAASVLAMLLGGFVLVRRESQEQHLANLEAEYQERLRRREAAEWCAVWMDDVDPEWRFRWNDTSCRFGGEE